MFEQLFKQPQALARQRAGPLLQERLRYLDHLADQVWLAGLCKLLPITPSSSLTTSA